MRVAIIPARGGSKRIPRKNIRAFAGRPMLAWPIAAARESGCFDRILVSTDDAEVADAARAAGAEVPFARPDALADDHTPTVPVVAHAVDWLQAQGADVEIACCLYPTAVFATAADLRAGRDALLASRADYAVPVVAYDYPPQRSLRIDAGGKVALVDPALASVRTQDLEPAWHDAGQFYWGRRDAWLAQRPILAGDAVALRLPRERVLDIDTPEDWTHAERLFRLLGRGD